MLLYEGIKRIHVAQFVAKNTVLRWIVSDSISSHSTRREATQSEVPLRVLLWSPKDKFFEVLNNFWKLEEVSVPRSKFTSAELSAEKNFVGDA
jgi:hypothetical protein